MTPDNRQVQIQFSENRRGAAGDAERGSAKQDEARGRGRERFGRKMKRGGRWSEVLNHPSVSAEGKSRPGWWGAEGGDVKIPNSVVQTLSSTTCFLSFLSIHSPLFLPAFFDGPLHLLLLLLLPANSKWLSLLDHSGGLWSPPPKRFLLGFCMLGGALSLLFITWKWLGFVKTVAPGVTLWKNGQKDQSSKTALARFGWINSNTPPNDAEVIKATVLKPQRSTCYLIP